MNSETAQIQALIQEIDTVLQKASPRLPWVLSGESAEQRRVLEQTRHYLVTLQQNLIQGRLSESGRQMGQAMGLSAQEGHEESAQKVLQAVLQEMNYLRTQMVQPLRGDIDRLHQERASLVLEVKQLEARRQQMILAQSQDNQQQIIHDFLQALMGQLQTYLTQQVAQTVSGYQAQIHGDSPLGSLPGSAWSTLTPTQRVEQIQQLQARSDQLLLKLDSTLNVIFESLQTNIQSYQESLSQGLEKMHSLGQQGEAMFAALVNRLAQQLGREASAYLQTSLQNMDWGAIEAAKRERLPNSSTQSQSLTGRSPLELDANDLISDDQIDQLLHELSSSTGLTDGGSAEESPFSVKDLTPPIAEDVTQFQAPERFPQFDEEDVTIFQVDDRFEVATPAPPSAGSSSTANISDEILELFPSLKEELSSMDSTLERLDRLNASSSYEQEGQSPLVETAGVPEVEFDEEDGFDESVTDDVPVTTPENLYEDDFYRSLFKDTDDETLVFNASPAAEAASQEAVDATSQEDDEMIAGFSLDEWTDALAPDAPSDSTAGSFSSSVVVEVPALPPIEADTQSLETLEENLFGGLDDPSEQGAIAEEEPARDQTLAELSTQSLQSFLFDIGSEPLFPNDRLPSDEQYGEDESGESYEAHGDGSTGDSYTSAGIDAISTLTDLIQGLDELPSDISAGGTQDDSDVTGTNVEDDDDRFMPAPPHEDLLVGEDVATVAPTVDLAIDDTTLQVLSSDLSNLETDSDLVDGSTLEDWGADFSDSIAEPRAIARDLPEAEGTESEDAEAAFTFDVWGEEEASTEQSGLSDLPEDDLGSLEGFADVFGEPEDEQEDELILDSEEIAETFASDASDQAWFSLGTDDEEAIAPFTEEPEQEDLSPSDPNEIDPRLVLDDFSREETVDALFPDEDAVVEPPLNLGAIAPDDHFGTEDTPDDVKDAAAVSNAAEVNSLGNLDDWLNVSEEESQEPSDTDDLTVDTLNPSDAPAFADFAAQFESEVETETEPPSEDEDSFLSFERDVLGGFSHGESGAVDQSAPFSSDARPEVESVESPESLGLPPNLNLGSFLNYIAPEETPDEPEADSTTAPPPRSSNVTPPSLFWGEENSNEENVFTLDGLGDDPFAEDLSHADVVEVDEEIDLLLPDPPSEEEDTTPEPTENFEAQEAYQAVSLPIEEDSPEINIQTEETVRLIENILFQDGGWESDEPEPDEMESLEQFSFGDVDLSPTELSRDDSEDAGVENLRDGSDPAESALLGETWDTFFSEEPAAPEVPGDGALDDSNVSLSLNDMLPEPPETSFTSAIPPTSSAPAFEFPPESDKEDVSLANLFGEEEKGTVEETFNPDELFPGADLTLDNLLEVALDADSSTSLAEKLAAETGVETLPEITLDQAFGSDLTPENQIDLDTLNNLFEEG